jgi:hypothetical protein
MVLKKWGVLFFLAWLPVFPVSAATVSFLVVETGLREDNETPEASSLWESGLMDAFFDAGHIVSNAPIKRLEQKPETVFPEEVRPDFDEAMDGGAEFFILALLDYQESSQKLQRVSLRLFRINPYQFMFEQQYSGIKELPVSEEFIQVKNAARTIVSHLKDR